MRHIHTAVQDSGGSWVPKRLTRPKSEDDKLNMATAGSSLKRSSSDSSSSRILRKAGRARSMMLFEIPLNLGKKQHQDACQSPRARPTISSPLEGSFQHLDGGGRNGPAIRKSLSEYNLARMSEDEPTGRDTRLRPGFVCLTVLVLVQRFQCLSSESLSNVSFNQIYCVGRWGVHKHSRVKVVVAFSPTSSAIGNEM